MLLQVLSGLCPAAAHSVPASSYPVLNRTYPLAGAEDVASASEGGRVYLTGVAM